MRILFAIVIFCFGINAMAMEKPYIISGFDDVLRQSDNTGLLNAAFRLFAKDETFTGMPELYQVVSQGEVAPHFFLVSAISSMFNVKIEKFFKAASFPDNKIYLRSWTTQWSIEDFKIEKIKEIIALHPNRQFIVIFDNSAPSIELANRIRKDYSNKIVAAYLHQIVKKTLPEGATGYFTAFDIAWSEFQANRLSFEELQKVANTILQEKRLGKVIPSYALKPIEYSCQDQNASATELCEKVQSHLRQL